MTTNTSHHNSVPRAMYHMTTSEAKGWCATFAIEAVVVAIGNLFIIIVFAKTHELRRKSQHFFLINLAVADLLVGTFAEPLFVYVLGGYYRLWSFEYPNIFIFASLFLDMFSGISSIAFLTAIALERLFATTYPVKYRKTRKLWYALVIVALWAVSAVIPIGRLMFGNDYDSLYLWMPFVCILLLLIGSAYFVIWVKLLFFGSKRLEHSRERHLNVTLTILTLTSLSTWLPFIVVNTVNMFQPVNLVAVHATKVLHYGNSLVNPFLFALKMPKFRKAAKKIFCRRRRTGSQNRNRGDKLLRDASTKNKSLELSSSSKSDRRNHNVKSTPV